jgi:transcriptional regulator with XRE-family HTH domain
MYVAVMEDDSAATDADRRVAADLRAARERAGLTQGQLADKMRSGGWPTFHQQTITRYEGGQRRLTTGEADALAAALGTTLTTLMRPEGLARESWLLLDAARRLRETSDQITALRLRQGNARAELERLVRQARDAGHAGDLGQEIAAAERALAAGKEK